jgi:hypothetical protein
MRRFRWVIVSAVFLLVGIVSLATGWKGNAGVNMAWPVAGAAVTFCGSAQGWAAVLGALGLLLGVIFLVVSVVSAATAGAMKAKS